MKTNNKIFSLETWGLAVGNNGELLANGWSTVELAKEYGTPLHVVNEPRLEQTANDFRQAVSSAYPGKTSVHYAFKCNPVPAIVETIRRAGVQAEVMTEFELHLTSRLGYPGSDIIVNGPCKTPSFLRACVQAGVRYIVIDSIEELRDLEEIAQSCSAEIDVLLRINPDIVPHGMNHGSATGSRKGCAFGLDLKGVEVQSALNICSTAHQVRFQGFHFHIGTGIREPKDYSRTIRSLSPLLASVRNSGLSINILDVGGGFASLTTREFTAREMLAYQGIGLLPHMSPAVECPPVSGFAEEIVDAVKDCFPSGALPELVFEPGRCIASPNQLLLLTVHRIKERRGAGRWLITDGGVGTVTLPTFYEYHEIFLCNDVRRPRTEKVTIIGPACFAGDVVYRNKRMPKVEPGDVLAVMDAGAYFTQLESSFGFPRPAIVSLTHESHRVIRRRETFDEMMSRDVFMNSHYVEENYQ